MGAGVVERATHSKGPSPIRSLGWPQCCKRLWVCLCLCKYLSVHLWLCIGPCVYWLVLVRVCMDLGVHPSMRIVVCVYWFVCIGLCMYCVYIGLCLYGFVSVLACMCIGLRVFVYGCIGVFVRLFVCLGVRLPSPGCCPFRCMDMSAGLSPMALSLPVVIVIAAAAPGGCRLLG